MTQTIYTGREKEESGKKLTLDLDQVTKSYVLYVCDQLEGYGADSIQFRKSSSGEGYHVKARFAWDAPTTQLRAFLGDDPTRLHRDFWTNKPSNILFDEKNGKQAGNWIKYK